MQEFQSHLDFYRVHPQMHFSKLLTESNWGNKALATKYMTKYWLNEHEYLNMWKPIQDKIFFNNKNLPDMVYRPSFEIIASIGGCLFIKDDFIRLQKTMKLLSNKYFVIIQISQDFTVGEPMFRMKFPVNITWEELTNGNYISAILLEMNHNEYFVFSESGNWGRYSANDYKYPVDIIGFKPDLTPIFRKQFPYQNENYIEVMSNLPDIYIKKLNQLTKSS